MSQDTPSHIKNEKPPSSTKANMENDLVVDASKESVDNEIKGKGKPISPKNFMEFVLGVYEGAKISQEVQKAFDQFNVIVSDEDRIKILLVSAKKDPEFKITLSLALAVLEGSMHARSHVALLSYIENIISTIDAAGENSTNTIFQSWLHASRGVSNVAVLFFDRIERIKGSDKKQLSKKKRQNILLIALIWLYYKQELEFEELLTFYSKRILSLSGESGSHIEPAALAFATSMVSSTKKSGFGYLLFKLVEAEQTAKIELRKKGLAFDHLEKRLETARTNNTEMAAAVDNLNSLVSDRTAELEAAKLELNEVKESARHASIHGEDHKEDLRVKFKGILEGGLEAAIKKAKISNSRIEANPKTEITDYQLDEALEIIQKGLSWLKS